RLQWWSSALSERAEVARVQQNLLRTAIETVYECTGGGCDGTGAAAVRGRGRGPRELHEGGGGAAFHPAVAVVLDREARGRARRAVVPEAGARRRADRRRRGGRRACAPCRRRGGRGQGRSGRCRGS